MYLRRIEIENIRSIRKLDWHLPDDVASPGWHVVLGNNGSGKSSFLQGVALALLYDADVAALREQWPHWIAAGSQDGSIVLGFANTSGGAAGQTARMLYRDGPNRTMRRHPMDEPPPTRFSVGYGPLRRFYGGDNQLLSTDVRRHASLLSERVALHSPLDWLRDLDHQRAKAPEFVLFSEVTDFVNQTGLLPNNVRFVGVEQQPDTGFAAMFEDGNNARFTVANLGDGYRAIMVLVLDLLRELCAFHGNAALRGGVAVGTGIVLVDEVDAHLHPKWQRDIGFWLTKHFPNIQFIVTTHSPLVCQAAEHGSIFVLPDPGSDDEPRMLEGIERSRLIYGSVTEAYSTSGFDMPTTRSEKGLKLLEELASLNIKALKQKLTRNEEDRRQLLRATLPTASDFGNGNGNGNGGRE